MSQLTTTPCSNLQYKSFFIMSLKSLLPLLGIVGKVKSTTITLKCCSEIEMLKSFYNNSTVRKYVCTYKSCHSHPSKAPCLLYYVPTSSVNQPSGHQTLWELMDLLGYIRQAGSSFHYLPVSPFHTIRLFTHSYSVTLCYRTNTERGEIGLRTIN